MTTTTLADAAVRAAEAQAGGGRAEGRPAGPLLGRGPGRPVGETITDNRGHRPHGRDGGWIFSDCAT